MIEQPQAQTQVDLVECSTADRVAHGDGLGALREAHQQAARGACLVVEARVAAIGDAPQVGARAPQHVGLALVAKDALRPDQDGLEQREPVAFALYTAELHLERVDHILGAGLAASRVALEQRLERPLALAHAFDLRAALLECLLAFERRLAAAKARRRGLARLAAGRRRRSARNEGRRAAPSRAGSGTRARGGGVRPV